MKRGAHPTRTRTRLSRAEIVETALTLLDEVGLDGLTTRRLAARLGVQVGALYWHIESKQDLLAAMADRIAEEFCRAPLPAGTWEEQVASEAQRLRRVLLSHRDGARLLVGAIGLGPNILGIAERFLRIMRQAGFPPEIAGYGWDTIASYVTGFVLQEQSAPLVPESVPVDPDRLAEIVDAERFPNLAEWLMRGPRSSDAGFTAKLGIIIRGLQTVMP